MISPRLMREGVVSKPIVLVVEDDPVVALDMEQLLHDAGFYVVGPALNLEAALRLLTNTDPDAAVLDFDLGGSHLLQGEFDPFEVRGKRLKVCERQCVEQLVSGWYKGIVEHETPSASGREHQFSRPSAPCSCADDGL